MADLTRPLDRQSTRLGACPSTRPHPKPGPPSRAGATPSEGSPPSNRTEKPQTARKPAPLLRCPDINSENKEASAAPPPTGSGRAYRRRIPQT